MHPPADPYARESRRSAWWIVVGVLILAVVLALGLGGGGPLAHFGTSPGDFARTGTHSPGETLRTTSDAPPPVLRTDGATGTALEDRQKTMPADVRAWLEHLERTERRRVSLATDQLSAAMVSLATLQGLGGAEKVLQDLLTEDPTGSGPEPPTAGVAEDAAQGEKDWRALRSEFDTLPPPAECVPIRNAYVRALSETAAMIAEIRGAISASASDPTAAIAALNKLKGTSSGRIDVAAGEADRGVGEVCERYSTPRWFSVNKDVGGGALSKLSGL
ncbi:MAG: hypothetical protein IT207_06620 [Fimbriimonadaceae bacterium]|nr:hypothetical protein [Fimbriimonadaceae bacterium]